MISATFSIDIARFGERLPADYPIPLRDLWVAGALHIALPPPPHMLRLQEKSRERSWNGPFSLIPINVA